MKYVRDAKTIFLNAVGAVQPQNFLRNRVKVSSGKLHVDAETFPLNRPCHIVGFGKAVLGMAVEMENILSSNLRSGILSIPAGTQECFKDQPQLLLKNNSVLRIFEGAKDNIPDLDAMEAAKAIKDLCVGLTKDDLLLVLISGGGSALLPLPKFGLSLDEKQKIIKNLSKGGANIIELNCVRKMLSELKGGGLAQIAYPCRVVTLILSDIVGDPIDSIASGPTVENKDAHLAMEVINKYNVDISEIALNILQQPKLESFNYNHVANFIIGNNEIACEAAKRSAVNLGYNKVELFSKDIQGDVVDVAKRYLQIALDEVKKNETVCIIGAGEPTVVVKGNGLGGRNQQLALEFSKIACEAGLDFCFLSCGTDGIDGPTDAAGAVSTTVIGGLQEIDDFLENNDAYSFFSRYQNGEFLVKTGHTGTNVMDLHILILKPKT
ncbi:PREDICTED: glycerate kinase [Nicrophorus vespilloides]|uniref:Glycerate kinase n=1 Tax=Nicrophorus vespilloides TaxID=110193 RepID=A0ABM1N0T7_NICVS|nr:PREDICTED: glycerate kinase [Nicrophorus vespilloides]